MRAADELYAVPTALKRKTKPPDISKHKTKPPDISKCKSEITA